jgi:hypothetical protein
MSENETNENNNNPPTTAVMVIGDSLKCIHGLDTFDINEWNEHCSDPANGHTESGQTKCLDCGEIIEFEGLPFQPITPTGKNIQLRCNECSDLFLQKSQDSSVHIKKLSQPNTQPQGTNQNE